MSHFFKALISLGAVGAWLGCFAGMAPAQVVVYDNLNTSCSLHSGPDAMHIIVLVQFLEEFANFL